MSALKKKLTLLNKLLLFIFFTCSKLNSQTLPYTNDFNNLSVNNGWTHYAISGSDNWTLSPVFGSTENYEWTTKGTNGLPSQQSEMVLETPNFDISSLTSKYCLSFRHNIKTTYTNSTFEYSTNNGSTWNTFIPSTNDQIYWQTNSGFYLNSKTSYYKSAINLSSLLGYSNVKFRFKFKTSSYVDGSGWAIDNFSIAPEVYNIIAKPSKTIEVSPLCTNVKLQGKMTFNTPYQNKVYNINIKVYLSEDQSIDSNDIVLKNLNTSIDYNTFDLDTDLTLPTNLQPNNYYILYKLDDLNIVSESNEDDNISFAELIIKPIFKTPYLNDFESNNNDWKIGKNDTSSPTIWELGKGKLAHISGTHSGENAWSTSKSLLYDLPEYEYQWVESPYLDLSSIPDQKHLSFWYKCHYPNGVDYYNNKYAVYYNTNCSNNTSDWIELYVIPVNTSNNWEFINIPLPTSLSSNNNIKFRITFKNSYVKPEGLIFDDFYVGGNQQDLLFDITSNEKRFTSPSESNFDLKFKINNTGLSDVTNLKIKFFFSQDNILDNSDIELGDKIISNLKSQYSLNESFNFIKPNLTSSQFYVFYKIDYENQISEINENNNIGSFEIENVAKKSVPYFNDFENETDGWLSNTTLGNDDWNLGNANGSILNTVFSGSKAWITNANGKLSEFSRMHLYTPVFDISHLNKPILEFDMLSDANNAHYNGCNISYSIDYGKTWFVLLPSNDSYSKWHKTIAIDSFTGLDVSSSIGDSQNFFDINESILSTHKNMNSRDIDRNTHYSIDITPLKSSNIRFRYNVAMRKNSPSSYPPNYEGVLIDNFSIKEGWSDLSVPYTKDLYLGSNSSKIKFTIDVKNNGNDLSTPSKIKYYLSSDINFSNDDYFIDENALPQIKPEFKSHFNNEFSLPNNLTNYNYLIYVIDPENTIIETNENNNIGYWKLNLGGVTQYPYTENFNNDIVHGWYGYSVTHFGSSTKTPFRVVNKLNIGQSPNYQERMYDGLYTTENPAYGLGTATPKVFFYIETPTFDFKNQTKPLFISFDIMSSGYSYKTGSNIEYTTNDGQTWTILGNTYDPNAINWYNTYPSNGLSEMNNEPGWFSLDGSILTVKKDITFLLGNSNVKFRIKGDGMAALSGQSPQGIRLDNFVIAEESFVNNYNCISTTPSITQFNNTDMNCWTSTNDLNSLLNKNEATFAWTKASNFANQTNNSSVKIDFVNQGDTKGTWIISPKFIINNSILKFKIAHTKKGSNEKGIFDSDDEIILKMSSNNGTTWTELYNWNSTFPQISNTGEDIEMELFNNGLYQFGFWATNGTKNENSETTFYIDDFEVTSKFLSSDISLKKTKFNYYPNPFNDQLNLNSEKEISEVKIYSLTGQLIKLFVLNSENSNLNLTDLSNGFYLMEIEYDNKKEIVKIIKK